VPSDSRLPTSARSFSAIKVISRKTDMASRQIHRGVYQMFNYVDKLAATTLLLVCFVQVGSAADLVIDNTASTSYYAEGTRLLHIDLKQRKLEKVPVSVGDAETGYDLIGFSPTGDLLGFSAQKVWAFTPQTRSVRTLFSAPAGEQVRYAAIKVPSKSVLVSLFPADYDASKDWGLSFEVKGLVELTWNGNNVRTQRVTPRREALPPGSAFDNRGTLYFPLDDIYESTMDEDFNLQGGRCIPLSTEAVFTGGGSPSTFGARSIAVSEKMIYAFVSRLGGSSDGGYLLRFRKPRQHRVDLSDENDYAKIMSIYRDSLASMEILESNLASAQLAASPNGKHVLIRCNGNKWFLVSNDGHPEPLDMR
jgi:hypothetical protein